MQMQTSMTPQERELAELIVSALKSDDSDNVRIFSSLRSLNEHVQQHRTK
jgi:hypothetical protein